MSGVSQAAQTGQQVSALSVPVVLASDQSALPIVLASSTFDLAITPVPCANGTVTSIAPQSSAVVILPSNANRQNATVYNSNTQILYLLVAAGTPSNTNYTVQMQSLSYYETPIRYTGSITGIWVSSSGAGNALATEYTT